MTTKKEHSPYGAIIVFVIFIVVVWRCSDNDPTPPPTRAQQVAGFFSVFDGSHRQAEKRIKAEMNDPGSYEHIRTGYVDEGDTIRVVTTFRGKNSFGGLVSQQAAYLLDGHTGDLLKFIPIQTP